MAARHDTCGGCGQALLVELVGHRAALTARTDAHPMPYQQAATLTGPNRLAWHAHQLTNGDTELRWIGHTHPADCTSDVIDHQCQAPPGRPKRPGRTQAPRQGDLFSAHL